MMDYSAKFVNGQRSLGNRTRSCNQGSDYFQHTESCQSFYSLKMLCMGIDAGVPLAVGLFTTLECLHLEEFGKQQIPV